MQTVCELLKVTFFPPLHHQRRIWILDILRRERLTEVRETIRVQYYRSSTHLDRRYWMWRRCPPRHTLSTSPVAETGSLSRRRSRTVRALLGCWPGRPRYTRFACHTPCRTRHLLLSTRYRHSAHISSIRQPSVYALGAVGCRTLARQRRRDQPRVHQRTVRRC